MNLLYVDSGEAMMYLGFGVLVIILWVLLIRYAVRADTVVKNQQAMIWFMILQCKKQGVPDEEIQNLKDHFGIK
jgi:high-affinity Fe2+/Pb2+ permease